MPFLERIQKLNVFWKRVITFGLLATIAVPFLILVGKNFNRRIIELNGAEFLEQMKLPKNSDYNASTTIEMDRILQEIKMLEEQMPDDEDANDTDFYFDEEFSEESTTSDWE